MLTTIKLELVREIGKKEPSEVSYAEYIDSFYGQQVRLIECNGVLIRYCVQIESSIWGMLEADGIFLFKLSLYVINKSQV